MKKLELFLVLIPVDYLKEVPIPETNKLLKHPVDLGEFIRCLGCWFYMVCLVDIFNRRDWWSTAYPKMSECAPFRLNKYMARTRFEGILLQLYYTDRNDVEYNDGFLHMRKIE